MSSSRSRATSIVVGAGPAGLMAAEVAAAAGHRVTVVERMPSAGRKLLMAGRGGLNLTHSEDLEPFLARYGTSRPLVEAAIRAFPPSALIAWAESLGQPTFIGSSGRVFPRAMKASPLLRAWLARLEQAGVTLLTRHRLVAIAPDRTLTLEGPDGARIERPADAVVLALGGGSWPRLGSDGTLDDAAGRRRHRRLARCSRRTAASRSPGRRRPPSALRARR